MEKLCGRYGLNVTYSRKTVLSNLTPYFVSVAVTTYLKNDKQRVRRKLFSRWSTTQATPVIAIFLPPIGQLQYFFESKSVNVEKNYVKSSHHSF